MSEEKKSLFESCEAVKKLNEVDGFDPSKYLRKEEGENGASFYLDTKFRLLWFRLSHPNGRIEKIPKVMNKDYATFEVRIYADANDEPGHFLANGFASRYRDDSTEYGKNFVETAETAALGRALKDAGYGTQFCDIALPNDLSFVDAGMQIAFDSLDENQPNPDADGIPDGVSEETKTEESKGAKEQEPVPEKKEPVLTADMPLDNLKELMTVDYAKKVKIDFGYDAGMTLGDIAVKKPKSIQFYATRSGNNLIKAAASFLLEAATQIA